MKRFKRFAAIFLSAAMVMTSFQVPAFAETGEEIVVGQDGSGSAVEIAAGAETEPEASPEAEAPEEQTQEQPAEEVTGADSNVYVYSAAQLVSALNGAPSEAADLSHDELTVDKLGKAEVTIVLKGNSSDYVIDSGMLSGGKINISKEIKENTKETVKKITIVNEARYSEEDEEWENITVDLADGLKEAVLEVPDGVELTLKGGTYNFGIVNNGYFRAESENEEVRAVIGYKHGNSFVNNKRAELDHAEVTSTAQGSAAIVNNKDAELTLGGGTQVTATDSTAKGLESITAITNEGTLLINNATVQADGNTVSSCAVENKSVLTIRGGSITSAGVAVYNTGTAEIGSILADDRYYVSVSTKSRNLPAILTTGTVTVKGSGTEIGYGSYGRQAVATTSLPGNKERFSAAGDGKFTMYGGTVYGIAYAGTNYPTLAGGTVRHSDGACVQYKAGEGENPAEQTMKAEEYCYIDKDGAVQSSWDADIKAGKTLIELDGKGLDTEGDITKVKTLEELEKAIGEKKGHIQIESGIDLHKNLTVSNNAVIDGWDGISIYDGGMITVPGDVTVTLNTSIYLRTDKEGGVGVSNNGILELKRSVYSYASAEVTAVKNAGTLTISDYASVSVSNGTGVENTGTFTLQSGNIDISNGIAVNNNNNGTFTLQYGSINNRYRGIAVKNAGNFVMKGGSVRAGKNRKDSYAIAYTGDHLPVLISGDVYGARYCDYLSDTEMEEYNDYWGADGSNWDRDENGSPVFVSERGAAVVKLVETAGKPDTLEKGSFLDAEGGSAKDSKNSDSIVNGVVQDTEFVRPEIPVKEEYLVMEVEEELNDEEIRAMVQDMTGAANVPVFGYVIDSSDPAVVEAQNGTEQNPKAHIKALKEGYAAVKIRLVDTASKTILAENYIRVEVVAKDKRKNLIAENYTGNILNQTLEYNGYWNKGVDVGFEYHLKSSDDSLTGAEVTLEKILSETYKVKGIRIDDKEFNDYFEIVPVSGEDGKNIIYDPQSKKYSFTVRSREKDGSTKLLIDDVKGINDIEVSAVLWNSTLKRSEVFKLGTFDISVKSVAPRIPTETITLNRFYDMNAAYEGENEERVYLNLAELGNVTDVVCPAGISYYEEYGDDFQNVITATGKKGGKITASVTIPGYVGEYPAAYSVKVVNKAPKAALKDKTIAVNGKAAEEMDLSNYLTAKDKESVDNIAKIEVIGKSGSSYKVVDDENSTVTIRKNGKVTGYQRRFCLQPTKKTIDKAETVKLKVTWRNTRKVKGSDYSSILSVKISPAKGFTVKQNKDKSLEKPILNTKIDGTGKDRTAVYFNVTPKTYKGGRFVVTGLNGKDAAPLDYLEAGSVEYGGDGLYYVEVAANAKTAEKGKAVKFAVDWVAPGEDGKEASILKNQKPAVMTVSLYNASDISVAKPDATVDLMKIKAADLKDEDILWSKLTASYKAKATGKWNVRSVEGKDGYLFGAELEDGKTVKVKPRWDAFYDGKIQAGNSYEMDVLFENEIGETKTVKLTYNVKDVNEKKVSVMLGTLGMYREYNGSRPVVSKLNGVPVHDKYGNTVYIRDENGDIVWQDYYSYDPYYTAKTSFTMYAKSPYTLDSFVIGTGSDQKEGKSFSFAPYYGLTVKDVRVAGDSPYEIIKFRGANGEQSQYALTFVGKKAPKIVSKKDVKKLESVTIEVVYTNGSKTYTSQQKFNVNVADKDLLLKSVK